MSLDALEAVARAALYEGYVLYPYRPSSLKNRQRWNFGGLYPRAWSQARGGATEGWALRLELLVEGQAPRLHAQLRFLHLFERGGWQEAVERSVALPGAGEAAFGFEPDVEGVRQEPVQGLARVEREPLGPALARLRVTVENAAEGDASASRDQALLRTLASAHLLLVVEGGAFVSQLDPPEALRAQVEANRSQGVFPVLVGEPGSHDAVLASPIILYDHPRVAPESQGDLFDATEIDEILTLRILTLTDAEKAEACAADPRARALLERTERLDGEALLKLHGAVRRRAALAEGR